MDEISKGTVPFPDLLIDLGDPFDEVNKEGFKFDPPNPSFNAADAISDVFGFFDPTDPDLLPTPPSPEAPTLAPANIFNTGGFEAPASIFNTGGFEDAPTTSFGVPEQLTPVAPPTGIDDTVRPFGGGDGDARPFGDAEPRQPPKHQAFVTPLLRTGGFEAVTPSFGGRSAQFGRGQAQFGGQQPFGGQAPPNGGRGFGNHRGNGDRNRYNNKYNPSPRVPWSGGRFDGGSGDCSGKSGPPTPSDSRFQNVSGFGRTNEDIALLPDRSRAANRKASRSGNNRSKRYGRSGRPREAAPDSADAKQAGQERPKEAAEQQPCDFGTKRERAKSLGENGQMPFETPHKRRRTACGNCGRIGHATEACYSVRNKESLRCYNCNNLGHLAVRCPRGAPRGRAAGGQHHKAPNRAGAAGEEEHKADANNNATNGSGLGIICKLMQDAQMRRETQRRTPKLYDEMLSFMLEHVKL